MNYFLIYLGGFFITLTFLKLFGVKMGIDYDQPHGDNYDDWDNNAQFFLFLSMVWIVTVPIITAVTIFKMLYEFTKWYIK